MIFLIIYFLCDFDKEKIFKKNKINIYKIVNYKVKCNMGSKEDELLIRL